MLQVAIRQWLDDYECLRGQVDFPGAEKLLLRPIVLYGEPRRGEPILMAYNPSRRFTEDHLRRHDLTVDGYRDLLVHGARFEGFYSEFTGKPRYRAGTAPRRDAHSRLQFLIQEMVAARGGVIMTNYYAYPASTENEMDDILKISNGGRGRGKHCSDFAVEISKHVDCLIRIIDPASIICMGDTTQGLMESRGYSVQPLRHPSPRADPNQCYPDRQTWVEAVQQLAREGPA